MGRTLKRINPRVVSYVDRRLLELFLKVLAMVINELPEPWEKNRLGRPSHESRIVAAMCVLKEAFGHTYDSLEAELTRNPLVKQFLGIDYLPGHSVVHRGMKKLPMWWIKALNKKLRVKLRRKINVIVDSSGFTTRNSSIYYDIRIKRNNKKREFLKLHIAVCAETGVIVSFKVTEGNVNDSPVLRKLLATVLCLIVIGDSAYASRENCNLVDEKKAIPFFLPRKNSTPKAKRSAAWRKMVLFHRNDKNIFLAIYHIRSFVESVISSVKRRFRGFLNSVKKRMQNKELSLKVISYNVRRLLFVDVAKEMGESLWVYKG